MRRTIAGMLLVSMLALGPACSYHRAHINYSDYADQIPIREASWTGEKLGPVAANKAGAIWNSCTKAAEGSMWVLIDETRRMEGNAIGDIRWIPRKEKKDLRLPTCKKGWAWFLVWPVLLTPVFMSSRVEAVAYKIPETAPVQAGVYRIPESVEEQQILVERILAETARRPAAGDQSEAASATAPVKRSNCSL